VTHAHPVPAVLGDPADEAPAEPGGEAGEVPAEPGAEAGEVPAEPGAEAGEVPAEPGAEAGEVPAELEATGSEMCLAGLENGPHAVSTSASRTSGMALNDFLTQAFMTIPSRTMG
jgi:hypothetical protein